MRNSMKIVSVAAILGIGSLWAETIPIKAVELTQESIEAEQTDVEDNINKANRKISKLQEEQAKASQEVEKLNNAISGTLQQINEKNQQTEEAKSKIETLQKEISEITGRIEKRNGLLKDRARSFQENGGEVSYIDVIFDAKSFTDFVDRAGAVAVIMEADRDLLEKHETDKNSLEKTQSELEAQLLSLEAMLAELEKLKEDLNLKKEEQNRIIGQLQESEKAVKAEVLSLEKERIILVNKKTEIENKKLTEQKNQSIAAAQNNQNGQGSAGTVSESPKVAQANGNGSFIWPTIGGVITTYQGMRWGSFHKGIDIARPADYSILAADSGKVTFAGWKNGYGNTIVIEHNNGYKTQYSHMDSLNVNAGEAVSQGSKIGIIGSTGFSTGIHLDFEVYYNGKLLNPMDVLPGR
ncbi:murein hydrolase activator EnvC family protein [Bacillus canaveralius]|uniref:murein hydrolase activator EnvC family protein n=1 Tax=Bacillus canaveralius TaxID=1403243 RepID=UPI000F7ACBE4|nr:M23 family metallopeptidase [Bacillus canaveralius]RSK52368.1 peptidase M23 [Bacillus canaveralius]